MRINISGIPFQFAAAVRDYVELRLLPLAHEYPTNFTIDLVIDQMEHRGSPRFLVRSLLRLEQDETLRSLRCAHLHEGIDGTARHLAVRLQRSRRKRDSYDPAVPVRATDSSAFRPQADLV